MIRLVIIEDEEQLRETNRLLLSNNFPNIKIVGEAGTVSESIEVIKEQEPDIVLFDIELKDGNSFQVLNSCKPITFIPIFITAFNQYAIKAIKFSALDYLLKPVNEFEFCNAINTALNQLNNTNIQQQVNNLDEQYKSIPHKKIILKTVDSIHLIDINKIMYCKSDNSYTSFLIEGKKEIIVSKSIKEYTELLEEYNFIRPHQSYLVNIDYIDKINKTDGGFIILTNSKEIPISKRRKNIIFTQLDES